MVGSTAIRIITESYIKQGTTDVLGNMRLFPKGTRDSVGSHKIPEEEAFAVIDHWLARDQEKRSVVLRLWKSLKLSWEG